MAVGGTNLDKNPGGGVQGTSYLYDYGTSPNTRTAVSQKVRVLTPTYGETTSMHQMGVVSNFAPSISRTVDELRGIGFGDQVAELVPSITAAPTANFERALLYLCNLWQATGYAAGVDGPVRSLSHHKWPFDIEQQLVFSTLADADIGRANEGHDGQAGSFDGGLKPITYPETTPDNSTNPKSGKLGHSALITIYEACWFTSWSATFAKDSGMVMESGDVMISDIHDFATMYGEFLATGNDPSLGQLGSIRFAEGDQLNSLAAYNREVGQGVSSNSGDRSVFNTADPAQS
jgi:hypothetical protein